SYQFCHHTHLQSFPTRRSSDLVSGNGRYRFDDGLWMVDAGVSTSKSRTWRKGVDNGHFQAINSQLTMPVRVSFEDVSHITPDTRSEEHTSELQSRENLVCRLLL